jgi:hypothetical protein
MIAIRTESGKNTIDGNIFKIHSNGSVSERAFNESELSGILKEYFGINL